MSKYDAINGAYAPIGQTGTSDATYYYLYSSLNAEEKAYTRSVLNKLDLLLDNDFVSGSLISSHLTVKKGDLSAQGADGITGRSSTTSHYANITIDTDIGTSADHLGVSEQQYFRYVVTHEIGHALGLKHPFDVQGSQNVVDDTLTPIQTIMAYANNAQEVVTNYSGMDIAAMIEANGIEDDVAPDGDVPVYRFYNQVTGGHFFTVNKAEATQVATTMYDQYSYEGNHFYADAGPGAGLVPVYRFFNTVTEGHFFTRGPKEKEYVENNLPQYRYEGIGFYAEATDTPSNEEVYRFYNARTQGHFFTSSEAERDNVIAHLSDYAYEGVAFYA